MYRDKYTVKRYRSMTAYIVLCVFFIMVMANALCIAAFNLMYMAGMIGQPAPMALLFLMLSISTIIGSVLTALFSGKVLSPLLELTEAMQRVGKGDFDVKISELSPIYEMRQLQENFNLMAKELGGTQMFRDDFINGFSHEFKTPMVSVYGFAKQLKNGGLAPEQQEEYIDIILSESQRLINLSGNILMLNKLENQEIVTDKELFSLDEEIRRSILLLEPQWSKKNMSVIPQLERTEFYGNAEMLKQVWLNVIGNAIKYTDENGEITVKLYSRKPAEVTVVVSDNGIGMDNATLSRIFEKFYRGDSAHGSGGNGLGLAMVKRIIELCGGTIKVKSEPSRGTDFYIYLPNENGQESLSRRQERKAPAAK